MKQKVLRDAQGDAVGREIRFDGRWMAVCRRSAVLVELPELSVQ